MIKNHNWGNDCMAQKTVVLGIDGVPYTFLQAQFEKGAMPNLAAVCKTHGMKQMKSVFPTISSVAWTTYMTGTNPARHNIMGFVDRVANPFEITINTGADRKAETIWEALSKKGDSVIVMNVPMTYPPIPVNGVLVAGFLCPDIRRVSYPAGFSTYLQEQGYCIDVDAHIAQESKREFISQLIKVMDNRFDITFDLLNTRDWDFFQVVIMETDRLYHFFWDDLEPGQEYSNEVEKFFKLLDDNIGKLLEKLPDDVRILLLSDHGFGKVSYEVQVNSWLEEVGLLSFPSTGPKALPNYAPESVCYSLLPGRIFLNLEGREEQGRIKKADYTKVRNHVKEQLALFKNPQTGEKIFSGIFDREEIYEGPYLEAAADIIVHPSRGYDLKSRVGGKEIFNGSFMNGMHTYSDAFICGINLDVAGVETIADVKSILVD